MRDKSYICFYKKQPDMRTSFLWISTLLLIVASYGCTPEEKPASSSGFDVRLEIPSEISIKSNATSIEFAVLEGKAPKQSDLMIFDGPAGQKFCKIISVSSERVAAEIYSGVKAGQHKISIQRGLDIAYMGTTDIKVESPSDEEIVKPEARSTVYGWVSCKGEGIPGVVVSDGIQVSVTDENGVYQLTSEKKNGYVFVSTPKGYEAPVDIVFPQFYKNTQKSASAVERLDFELTKAKDQTAFTLLVLGDIHLARRHNDLAQFPRFAEDVKAYVSANPNELFYGATLGDMVHDQYWVSNNFSYPEYKKEMEQLKGLPIYHTIGNHDHSLEYSGDFDTTLDFRKHIGPNYYSYNIGNIHFITLDNIECMNAGNYGRSDYNVNIPAEQLEWLKKDLSYVPKTTPVFLFMHSTFHNNPGLKDKMTSYNLDNGADVAALLSGYPEVHIFTAHTHTMFNGEKEHFYEHNAGAVCAAWWVSGLLSPGIHVAKDGAPGGYHIVKIRGKEITWQYKGVDLPVTTQFRTYDRNNIDISADTQVPNANATHRAEYETSAQYWLTEGVPNEVYINVWNVDPKWKVEVKEDGKLINAERIKCSDPLYLHSALAKRQNSNTSSDGYHSYHMYKVVASSPNSTLDITVTDRFGNVYKETMKRPRPFTIDEYRTY